MALVRFLWEQIDHIRATNYASPTLLFTGVLAELTQASIYRQSGRLYTSDGRSLPYTLAKLGSSAKYGSDTFRILEEAVVNQGYRNIQVNEHQALLFGTWIERILKISFIRNAAARHANVTPKQLRLLISMYLDSLTRGISALKGLLPAWQSEQP